MKYLFFSDLHCHNYLQFATRLSNGRNSRLQDCLNIVNQAQQICLSRQVDKCFFLGDLFESRTRIDIDVYSSAWQAFKELSDVVNLTLLIGNHDQHSRVGDVHAIKAFSSFAKVIEEPILLDDVYCCSHLPSEAFREVVKQAPACRLFLFHQATSEGFIGPYNKTVRGEISLSDLDFSKVHRYFAGDYHKRQSLGPDDRVHYIGSPLQLSFSERGETKAFSLYDTETDVIEAIPTIAPHFHLLEGLDHFFNDFNKGDFVRLIVPKSDVQEAEKLKRSNPNYHIQIQVVPDEHHQIRTHASFKSNHRDLLQEWIDQCPSTLPRDQLLEFGLEMLSQANNL